MSRYPTDRKVYVGDLGNNARKNDLEYAFSAFGTLRSVWIARNPPGFAFVEFEDARDAADAVRGLDGRTVCGRRARVELSTGKFAGGSSRGGDRRGGGDRPRGGRSLNSDDKCYECGGRGHYARDCRRQARSRRRSNSRSRSRSASRNPKSRSRSISPSHSRSRSPSPSKDLRKPREAYGKHRTNGRSENGDTSRYSDDGRNGGADSPPVTKRRYANTSVSPKHGSQVKRDDSSMSRSPSRD